MSRVYLLRLVINWLCKVENINVMSWGVDCSENTDWWLARHTVTGEQGYIPSNYVVEDDNSPESQEYVFLPLIHHKIIHRHL